MHGISNPPCTSGECHGAWYLQSSLYKWGVSRCMVSPILLVQVGSVTVHGISSPPCTSGECHGAWYLQSSLYKWGVSRCMVSPILLVQVGSVTVHGISNPPCTSGECHGAWYLQSSLYKWGVSQCMVSPILLVQVGSVTVHGISNPPCTSGECHGAWYLQSSLYKWGVSRCMVSPILLVQVGSVTVRGISNPPCTSGECHGAWYLQSSLYKWGASRCMVSPILLVQVGSAAYFPSLHIQALLHELKSTRVPCLILVVGVQLQVCHRQVEGKRKIWGTMKAAFPVSKKKTAALTGTQRRKQAPRSPNSEQNGGQKTNPNKATRARVQVEGKRKIWGTMKATSTDAVKSTITSLTNIPSDCLSFKGSTRQLQISLVTVCHSKEVQDSCY